MQTKYLDVTPEYVTIKINSGFNHACTVHSHSQGVNIKLNIFKMYKNRFETKTK